MHNEGGFGLYVHWPYCTAKCPYCDFNSFAQTPEAADIWSAAYISEIERHGTITGPKTLNSIYIGGGTPSLMEPQTMAALIDTAQKTWAFANDIEITMEANPTSVERDRLQAFKSAGINRLSLGVQALNSDDLARLGRTHSVTDALHAIAHAKSVFDRMSFDLIYARQDQTLDGWTAELTQALQMDPTHLSLYQLTIEPNTPFYDRFHRGGLRGLPDEDLAADIYDATQDITSRAGLPAYEVSNHAVPGQESTHNMIYWSGGDYVGIGPGAHGRIHHGADRHATETYLNPKEWLAQVKSGSGTQRSTQQTKQDIAAEYVMMGLRREDGISLSKVKSIIGQNIDIKEYLFEIGVLEINGDMLRTTPKGRPLLNQIISELLP